MPTIVTRASKGSPLNWTEADNNFKNLNYSAPISVKDSAYGAKGDGVTDDTAAIQAAINSAPGGGVISFPIGWYKVTGLNITQGGITLKGQGPATKILASNNTSTVVNCIGTQITIDQLSFHTVGFVQRTGGKYIQLNSDSTVSNCHFGQGFTAIAVEGSVSIYTIDSCVFRDFNTNNTSDVIFIDTVGADGSINDCIFDNNASLMPRSGIRLYSCQDVTLSNLNIIQCGNDLLIDPPNGKVVASLYASNTFFDTAKNGILITPQAGGAVVRTNFVNCWASSHTQRGIVIDGTNGNCWGICFVNQSAHLNTLDAIFVLGSNTTDIVFNGGEASQNGGSGFTTGPNATSFYLRNFHAGSGHGLSGNPWGCYINADATNYEISGCVFEGNTIGQFADLAKTGRVFHNYNLTGVKTYNSGIQAIVPGTNTITINHGLNATPSAGDINITPLTAYIDNFLYLDSTSINSTSFKVYSRINVVGVPFDFGWSASCQNDH
jgi:hypothetical protein